jgi:hypothetical protein
MDGLSKNSPNHFLSKVLEPKDDQFIIVPGIASPQFGSAAAGPAIKTVPHGSPAPTTHATASAKTAYFPRRHTSLSCASDACPVTAAAFKPRPHAMASTIRSTEGCVSELTHIDAFGRTRFGRTKDAYLTVLIDRTWCSATARTLDRLAMDLSRRCLRSGMCAHHQPLSRRQAAEPRWSPCCPADPDRQHRDQRHRQWRRAQPLAGLLASTNPPATRASARRKPDVSGSPSTRCPAATPNTGVRKVKAASRLAE